MGILWTAIVAGMTFVLALPLLASADEIVNDLDTSADLALETMTLAYEGQSTTLRLRITNDDGRNGCNFGGRGNPTLVIAPVSSDPSVAAVAPSSLVFDACGEHQQLQVTAAGEGSTRISFRELSNTTQGSFNLETGAFTVVVARPRTPTPVPPAPPTPTRVVASDAQLPPTSQPPTVTAPSQPQLATPTQTTEQQLATATSTATPEPATATPTRLVVPIGGGGALGGGGPLGNGQGVNPAQTPELGSLLLFGSGAAGITGYAWARLRRRRPS